jgi:hypothetical protein
LIVDSKLSTSCANQDLDIENLDKNKMNALNTWNIKKDLNKIRTFSSIIEKKLGQLDKKDESKIENLSFEELQDLNQLVHASDYILTKYESKKEVYDLLKDFVEMINNSTASMDILNDKISELVVSAESAISRIKSIQGDVSEDFSLKSSNKTDSERKTVLHIKQVQKI